MTTQSIHFRLAIPAADYLAYYKGQVREVVITLTDGRRVKFPASALQSVVSHQGIYGVFELRFDEQNKLQGLSQISD